MSDLEKHSYLSDAEVMSWSINGIPHTICEGKGPLVVKKGGEVVRSYPWHCVPMMDDGTRGGEAGKLYVFDMLRHRAIVGSHDRGTFDLVQHEPKFKVIILPRPGDRIRA